MPLRRAVTAALLALVPVAATALLAQPALAHGAMGTPVSRAVECGPMGGAAARSAACQAAMAASGGTTFANWDDIRVPNVNGQDRQRIPDGKLCSGGLTGFAGLDLARADWPTTTLAAGATVTFRYRVTIPHKGSFRLYLTHAGYQPTVPLRWADLSGAPFLTVTDPPVQSGAYTFTGRLPTAPAGRQLILTIWQTTSTPDTYYSCSDVVLTGTPAASPSMAPGLAPRTPGTPATTGAPATAVALASANRSGTMLPVAIGAAGVVLVAAAVALTLLARRRAR